MSETADEMAWRLVWVAQWKIQQESRHIEPRLPKMIGHMSVYNQVSDYMEKHHVSNGAELPSAPDFDVGQVEDIILGGGDDDTAATDVIDELSQLLSHASKDAA